MSAHGLHYLSDESTHWCNCGREFKSRRGLWQHCHLAGNLDEARAKQAEATTTTKPETKEN